jgi:HPt (histidine-containing phosphotransfer) domain-containing protein
MNLVVEKLTLNCEKLIEITEPFFNKVHCPEEQDHFMAEMNTSLSDKKTYYNDLIMMDYEKALREFEYDDELLLSLIEDFNKNIHSQLILMKKAFDIKDYHCIQSESHGIKGGAGNLCAMPLAEAAKSLEKACKQSADDEIIFGLLENLETDINLFDEYVRTTLSKCK